MRSEEQLPTYQIEFFLRTQGGAEGLLKAEKIVHDESLDEGHKVAAIEALIQHYSGQSNGEE